MTKQNSLEFIKSLPYYYPALYQAFLMLIFLMLTLNPYIQYYYFQRIPEDIAVDPEYINGLLTISSILFGFSSLLAFQQREENPKLFFVLLYPLFFIGQSAGTIWNIVIGLSEPVHGLLSAWTSVLSSMVVTWFLTGYLSKGFTLKKQKKPKIISYACDTT